MKRKQKIITATCVLFCSLSNAQTITTIAGGGTSGYGTIGPAITATFNGIGGLVFDKAGNFTLGLTEQHIFAEMEIDRISRTQGMDITFVIKNTANYHRILITAYSICLIYIFFSLYTSTFF